MNNYFFFFLMFPQDTPVDFVTNSLRMDVKAKKKSAGILLFLSLKKSFYLPDRFGEIKLPSRIN